MPKKNPLKSFWEVLFESYKLLFQTNVRIMNTLVVSKKTTTFFDSKNLQILSPKKQNTSEKTTNPPPYATMRNLCHPTGVVVELCALEQH